jgi:citrate lyase subunit alpha/citrate CoA-transferase
LVSLDSTIEVCGLSDGMTISFRHSLRSGDRVVSRVLDACASRGIEGLRVLPIVLFPVHDPLIEHIRSGVVARIEGLMNRPIGAFISEGRGLAFPWAHSSAFSQASWLVGCGVLCL